MRKITLLVSTFLMLFSCNSKEQEGIVIHGNVKNSDSEYIVLSYEPRYRGILNYDGFKSLGTFLDEKGSFTLSSEKITEAANYSIFINSRYLSLVLFKGDNINLELDFADLNNPLFATGKGAGKINVLNLDQFDFVPFNLEWTFDRYNIHTDSIISSRLNLLDAIYSKNNISEVIVNAKNKDKIERVINESPLSIDEYEFLKKQTFLKKYEIVDFMNQLSNNKLLDSTSIDFNSSVFNFFNEEQYSEWENINDWHLADALDKILYVEFLKSKHKEDRSLIYKDRNSISDSPLYKNWVRTFLKNNFKTDVIDKFYADQLAWLMTLGFQYEELYEKFKRQNVNKKYLNRLMEFSDLLDKGLNNSEYNLNADSLSLDNLKFNSLIDSYRGKSVYIVFWSAQFAGSSIIKDLPAFKDFEKANKNEIVVLNICIDKAENKNLWATRIIDNLWKSTHYFLPIEGNGSTLNKISNKNISAFCDGGVTYTIIDKDGNIINEVEAPTKLSKGEINKYLK